MIRLERWVLHSPYPDGTWRGIENCQTRSTGGPLLFDTEDDAVAFRAKVFTAEEQAYWRPVRVLLTVPAIRTPLEIP